MHSSHRPNSLEVLESRKLMSAQYPSDLEQYMVELINRARANPGAEAARYGIDLNEGLPSGTLKNSAVQPLAINPLLTDAARKHSAWMLATDTFGHTGSGNSSPMDRMKAAGYKFDAPWSWAENLALRTMKTVAIHQDVIEAMEKDLFVDLGIPDRGHRVNLLAAESKEIGVGLSGGLWSNFNGAAVTQNFASSANATFLTGVAFTDAVKKDNFYTPGEGLGGVTITARRASDGATFTTSTWSSGGYSLKLGAGTYKVTASGGKLNKTVTLDSVTVGSQNVKRDFTSAATTPTVPPVVPPTTPPTVPPPPTPPQAPADKKAPTAASKTFAKKESSRYYRFTVTYSDDTNVLASSLGTGDVLVKGDGNYARTARFVSIDNNANGKNRTATYEVKGPKGRWNASRNGTYSVWLKANEVKDTSGNWMPGKQIGTFAVEIPVVNKPAAAATMGVKKAFEF